MVFQNTDILVRHFGYQLYWKREYENLSRPCLQKDDEHVESANEADGKEEMDEEKELKKKQSEKFRELLRDKVSGLKLHRKSSHRINCILTLNNWAAAIESIARELLVLHQINSGRTDEEVITNLEVNIPENFAYL